MNKDFDELVEKLQQLIDSKASDEGKSLGDLVPENDPTESDPVETELSTKDSAATNPEATSRDNAESEAGDPRDETYRTGQAIPTDLQISTLDTFTTLAEDTNSYAEDDRIWSRHDDWILRLAWGTVQISFIATILKRSAEDIRQRAIQLRARRSGRWTQTESQLLKKLYGSRKNEDLEVTLMRSGAQIEAAAKQLNLIGNRSPVEMRKIAADLGKDNPGTRRKSTNSRTRPQRGSMPRWSQAEIDKLQTLYSDHGNQQIAIILGRSITSIANKAWQLGLTKSSEQLTLIGRNNVARRHKGK